MVSESNNSGKKAIYHALYVLILHLRNIKLIENIRQKTKGI